MHGTLRTHIIIFADEHATLAMDSNDSTTLRASSATIPTDVASTPDLPPFDPYRAPERYGLCPPHVLPSQTPVNPVDAYHQKEDALPLLLEASARLEQELSPSWLTLTTYLLLNVNLASESVVNTSSSHTPRLTGASLMQLCEYFEDINSSSDLDENDMLMAGCITTLSAVEWVEGESSRRVPGSLRCNAAIVYITQISRSHTLFRKELGTMWGTRATSWLRISEGRVMRWAPAHGNRKLRGLHASMHRLRMN